MEISSEKLENEPNLTNQSIFDTSQEDISATQTIWECLKRTKAELIHIIVIVLNGRIKRKRYVLISLNCLQILLI